MLRVSILAIAAVALAACDDEEVATVEQEAEVAAVEEEPTTEEPEMAEAGPEVDEPEVVEAEPEGEAEDTGATQAESEPAAEQTDIAEAEPEPAGEEAAMAEGEGELAEGETTELETEEVTVLTDEDPAVETEVVTDPGAEQQETAAAEGDEQVAMAREGDLSDAMAAYQDWAVGRWATDANCEAEAVVLQENSISLPGDVSCDEVQVSSAGQDSLAITGMSCEGAASDQVELEVTQTADGLTVSRAGQETQLDRCP